MKGLFSHFHQEEAPQNRLIFGYFYHVFLGGPNPIFRQFFLYFGPRPEIGSPAGQGNRNCGFQMTIENAFWPLWITHYQFYKLYGPLRLRAQSR